MRWTIYALLAMLTAGLLVACLNGQNTQQSQSSSSMEIEQKVPEGYLSVSVKRSSQTTGPCSVLLQGENLLWEPLTLEGLDYSEGTVLFVKLQAHRRPSQCGGTPCEILDIQLP